MDRRDFVKTAAAGGAAAALAGSLDAQEVRGWKNGIGLQLWTVRNQIAADPKSTLKSIADAGYRQIELMNVVHSGDLVKSAQDLDLEVRSAFFNWETVATPNNPNVPRLEEVIEGAQAMGLKYLVFGYIGKAARDTADKLRAIADNANAAGEKVAQAGMQMSYHNHSFEFEKIDGDQTGFDIFIERFDAQLVNFELDVFWTAIGGWDPVATLKRLGSRVAQVHLKDLKAGAGTIYDESQVPEDAFQEVGDGVLDMQAILDTAVACGVTQFHVEQDQSPDPLTSIRQSIQHVRKIW